MICVICGKEKGDRVFTGDEFDLIGNRISFKHITGICFDCYNTKPDYIPIEQVRKFLESRKTK